MEEIRLRPKDHPFNPKNTSVFIQPRRLRVRLYETDIVTLTPKEIILQTGGWNTRTTFRRMNQVFEWLGIAGYSPRNYQYFVHSVIFRITTTTPRIPYDLDNNELVDRLPPVVRSLL